jgi:hypothetical protein
MSLELSNDAVKVRREYHQNWRKNNKQRVKEYNAQYWERKALEKKLQKSGRSNKND